MVRRGACRALRSRAAAAARAGGAGVLWLALAAAASRARCVNDCSYGASSTERDDGSVVVDLHGYCDDGVPAPLCQCTAAWDGGAWDCSARSCAAGVAWFDMPVDATTAHTGAATCSGKGACVAATGACACAADFEGAACQRTVCPGVTPAGAPCSGHGRCVSMAEAALGDRERGEAATAYGAWDAAAIQGCVCDDGWDGYDCSQRACPTGSDPLWSGDVEVQAVRLELPRAGEVQVVAVAGAAAAGGTGTGGTGDVDDVQQVMVAVSTAPATTTFTLTLDSTGGGGGGGCNLCTAAASVATTAPIVVAAGSAAAAAAATEAALNALPNVGAGGVSVTGVLQADARSVALVVTFSGLDVGGTVTLLTATRLAATDAAANVTVTKVVDGSEVAGTVTLAYDDAGAWPTAAALAAGGDTTDAAALALRGAASATALAVGASSATIAAALTALLLGGLEVASGTALTVSRVGVGGPGIEWRVTFGPGAVRTRGDVAPLTVAASSLTLGGGGGALTGGTASAAASTATDGAFMAAGATFTLQLPYTLADGVAAWTPATAPLAWNVGAAAVAAALNAFDAAGYGTGAMAVSRSRYSAAADTASAWSGGYEWRITYTSVAGDVAPAVVGAVTGAAPAATVTVATVTGGDAATAEVNAVQLIDCACAACSASATQGVRLTWRGATTAAIPYTASAADVRAALLALGNLADVAVTVVDTVSGTTAAWCDADGSTTAITFTHTPGDVPPLSIRAAYAATDVTLPASATLALRTTGAGTYGGVARRGTRRALPCSGRGTCGADGACTCYGAGAVRHYGASDGGGGGVPAAAAAAATVAGAGTPNCGYPLVAITACPADATGAVCAGVGTCSGAPSYRCTCPAGRDGSACEYVACGTGNAWFGRASASEPTGHSAGATCSARGVCDRSAGTCTCGGTWRGGACQYMACPPGGTTVGYLTEALQDTCAGGAACVTLAQLAADHVYDATDSAAAAAFAYTAPWDAHQIRGCACSHTLAYVGPNTYALGRRTGWACTEVTCPTGPDPHDSDALGGTFVTEVQRVTCTAPAPAAGFATPVFRGTAGRRLPLTGYVRDDDAPAAYVMGPYPSLQRVLYDMEVLGRVFVTPAVASGVLCTAAGAVTDVTFASLEGPLPLLAFTLEGAAAGVNITVSRVAAAASTTYECSRRGVCDRATGRCACAAQYGNSDGAFAAGQQGDCGNKDVMYGLTRSLATAAPPAASVAAAEAARIAVTQMAYVEALPFVT